MHATYVGEYEDQPLKKVMIFRRDDKPNLPNNGIFWIEVYIEQPADEPEHIQYDENNPVISQMISEVGEDEVSNFFKNLVSIHTVSWFISYRELLNMLKRNMYNADVMKNMIELTIARFERTYGVIE